MPNLLKNPFSTDFYRLFQSTDKKMIYGRIYGFCLTWFGYCPPPHIALSRSRYSTRGKRFLDQFSDFFVLSSATTHSLPPRAECTSSAAPSELFRLLPEISGFFGIPIGQPWDPHSMLTEIVLFGPRFAGEYLHVYFLEKEILDFDENVTVVS